MTFLAPALLALGLAAAIPLALHLLQRHQGPRVVFPAVRYLRRAEREHATRLRLRQVLLLALRILALVLLAAAAARPFLPIGGRDHHPTSVVIILDNSLASGTVVDDRRVLDHLADAALATLDAAGPDDRIWLVRAGHPWEPALTGEPGMLTETVRRTEPTAAASDLPGDLARAASMLATEPAGRATEIHLLSHLRGSTAARAPARAAETPGPPILVLEPPAAPSRNRAVTAVEVGGGLPPRVGDRSTVTARIDGFGFDAGEPADSTDVRLVVDGEVQATTRMAIGAVASLTVPARGPGLFAGRVEIDPDALAADDRRYFVADVRPPPQVWLAERLPFLDEAVAVLEDAGRVRQSTAAESEVVIAPGALGVDALRRGAAVVVLPPSSPLELGAANQRLSAAGIPWRLAPPAPGEARLDAAGSGLEHVLDDVRLRQVYGLEPTGERKDTVLLRLRTGEPWAVAGETPSGRFVLLGTPLTPEAGTIPTSAAMLPLLDRALGAWVVGQAARREHGPGDVVTLTAGDAILRPDGRRDPIQAGAVYRLTQPGLYQLLDAGELIDAFAVNPSPGASDTRPISSDALVQMLPGHDLRPVRARSWERAIFHDRLGRDIALPLLLAAAILLLLESALAAAGRGRRRRHPGTEPGARRPAPTVSDA
jgi:hypothetical protein